MQAIPIPTPCLCLIKESIIISKNRQLELVAQRMLKNFSIYGIQVFIILLSKSLES